MVEKCERESSLTSMLAEKCEQHLEELRKVATANEEHIKEITDNYSAKVSELESSNQTQASKILQLNNLLNTANASKQTLEEECQALITKHAEERRQMCADDHSVPNGNI